MSPALLPRVAQGDRAALNECIQRYGSLVWSLARRASPSASDAEDAVQEIFVEVWKSASRFDPRIAGESTFVAMIFGGSEDRASGAAVPPGPIRRGLDSGLRLVGSGPCA